jgi:hypothetical protein
MEYMPYIADKQLLCYPAAHSTHYLLMTPLLQTGIVATRTHLTIAMGLSWPVAIMTMRHNSDGRKMTPSTSVATVKSEPSFKYQVARLFGIDIDAS